MSASVENPARTRPTTSPRTEEQERTKQPHLWNVVLLDDDDHTYEYVMAMMQELFGHPIERGLQIAQRVDSDGRAVCLTTHLEHAELKRDQILAYGKDALLARSAGSMTAVLEPAEFDGDDSSNGDGADER